MHMLCFVMLNCKIIQHVGLYCILNTTVAIITFFGKQTLTSNLTELQQEKSDLQGKLDHLTQSMKVREGLSPVTSGPTGMTPATPFKNVDLEMKQLQCKLKVTAHVMKLL